MDNDWVFTNDHLSLEPAKSLFAWAEGLDDYQEAFLDTTAIPEAHIPFFTGTEVSGTYWASFSAAVGSLVKNIGAMINLEGGGQEPNTMDRHGWEYLNRTFMLKEAPSRSTKGMESISLDDEIGLSRLSALLLKFNDFGICGDEYAAPGNPPSIEEVVDDFAIEAPCGLRCIIYRMDDDTAQFEEFLDEAPFSRSISGDELQARFGIELASIRVVDTCGGSAEITIERA